MNNFPAFTEAQRQELIRHNRAKVNAITPQFLKESTPGVKKHLQREIDSAKIAIAALTAEPEYYFRKRSDGGREGPIHRTETEDSRKGSWSPLYNAPPAPVLRVPAGWKLVPSALTAENGAKAALLGEFTIEYNLQCHECFGEGCDDCDGEGRWVKSIPVDWTTIKAIWAKGVEHFQEVPTEASNDQ